MLELGKFKSKNSGIFKSLQDYPSKLKRKACLQRCLKQRCEVRSARDLIRTQQLNKIVTWKIGQTYCGYLLNQSFFSVWKVGSQVLATNKGK